MAGAKRFLVCVFAGALVASFCAIATGAAPAHAASDLASLYGFSLDTEAGALVAEEPASAGANAGAVNIASNGSGFLALASAYKSSSDGKDFIKVGENLLGPLSNSTGFMLAVGNVTGDEKLELIAGQESGGSRVTVYTLTGGSGTNAFSQVGSFDAFESGFKGGVRVAVGDVDGNGTKEVLAASGPGRAGAVRSFSATGTQLGEIAVFGPTFRGGAWIAAANLDEDATDEIVVGAGPGGGPHVAIHQGMTAPPSSSFFASDPAVTTGVRVAAGSVGGLTSIVTTTRKPTGIVVRVFDTSGSARTAERSVPQSDGDLSITILEGKVYATDTIPRLVSFSPAGQKLWNHGRAHIKLHGPALGDLVEDVRIGTEEQALVVAAEPVSTNQVNVSVGVPVDTPAGETPIEVDVRYPGATTTYTLRLSGLQVTPQINGPEEYLLTSPGVGGGPHVQVLSASGSNDDEFFGPGSCVSCGARVAVGDLGGEGRDSFAVATGPGDTNLVQFFTETGQASTIVRPYGVSYRGGVFAAIGDVNSAGPGELITGTDTGGGPHVRVIDTQGVGISEFFAYSPAFLGGVRVASGDVTGDGVDDIITAPGPGGGPHIKVFDGFGTELASFFAYDESFKGGVFIATADVDGDGVAEIVTGPGAGGGPHVRIFDLEGPRGPGFMAFDPNFRGGITVARIGDSIIGPNLIAVGAGPGAAPHVRVVEPDGAEVDSFYAYDEQFTGGVFVAGGIG